MSEQETPSKADTERATEFECHAPEAEKVFLAGSFNDCTLGDFICNYGRSGREGKQLLEAFANFPSIRLGLQIDQKCFA